ncbi:RHS repeat domain-containing protein [Streptomyces sp. NPDC055955]|uniref:RHS repeat domain-containing protein n=1 Tax=Streptomyces sp. NPDC055955 TaxID=3345665 RepID=UPI0035DEEECC
MPEYLLQLRSGGSCVVAGRTIRYTYDSAGQLTGVTSPARTTRPAICPPETVTGTTRATSRSSKSGVPKIQNLQTSSRPGMKCASATAAKAAANRAAERQWSRPEIAAPAAWMVRGARAPTGVWRALLAKGMARQQHHSHWWCRPLSRIPRWPRHLLRSRPDAPGREG